MIPGLCEICFGQVFLSQFKVNLEVNFGISGSYWTSALLTLYLSLPENTRLLSGSKSNQLHNSFNSISIIIVILGTFGAG